MSEQTQEQTVRLSVEEMMDSLTGFDEIAIEQAFGGDLVAMLSSTPTKGLRALIFVEKRRGGMKDVEARKAAMDLRLGDVQSYFASEDDHPESPEGKDETPPA